MQVCFPLFFVFFLSLLVWFVSVALCFYVCSLCVVMVVLFGAFSCSLFIVVLVCVSSLFVRCRCFCMFHF